VHVDVHAVARGVAPDALGVVGVALDGVHVRAEAGALDADRPAAGADVPDHVAQARAEPGEHDGPHLRLGDHRVAVVVRVDGQRPAGRARGGRRP
jgi:hypothetical protein